MLFCFLRIYNASCLYINKILFAINLIMGIESYLTDPNIIYQSI